MKTASEEDRNHLQSCRKGGKGSWIRDKVYRDISNKYLPEEYLRILRIVNGIEYNGFLLYRSDKPLLNEALMLQRKKSLSHGWDAQSPIKEKNIFRKVL